MGDKYYSDAEQQSKLNVHDLVTKVRHWMNVDREHWTDHAETEAAYLSNSHKNLSRSDKSNSNATQKAASKPNRENKFGKVNYGKNFRDHSQNGLRAIRTRPS